MAGVASIGLVVAVDVDAVVAFVVVVVVAFVAAVVLPVAVLALSQCKE